MRIHITTQLPSSTRSRPARTARHQASENMHDHYITPAQATNPAIAIMSRNGRSRMSSTTFGSGHSPAIERDGTAATISQFLNTYVFSRDHKIIGLQFLFSTLLWFLVGGLLALGIRWQLAWPCSAMPVIGRMLFGRFPWPKASVDVRQPRALKPPGNQGCRGIALRRHRLVLVAAPS